MNSSFSPAIPNLQFAWDSTSLNALKTCPRYYEYSIIQGWTSSQSNIHLAFGQHYHGALERYDHERCKGASHDEALRASVLYVLCVTWDSKLSRPLSVFCEDPNKNRETLLRTVVWYLDQFHETDENFSKTIVLANGKPAVELSFRFETEHHASDGTPFLYCGHIDRMIEMNGEPYVLDRKTTKHTISESFFASFNPSNQFLGYVFAAKVTLPEAPKKIVVDAAQVAVTFSRFERGLIEYSDSQLNDWYRGLGYWFKIAEGFARANYWPMNEASCGNYGGCPFRPVCSCKSESVKEMWLRAKFVKRVWDPLQVRGDV